MTGSVDGSVNLLEGCKVQSPVASSLENFGPQDGHIDDKSIIDPCAVEVMDIVEKKTNNLGGIETDNGDQISLSQGFKVHSEVRPLSGLLSDGSHENEQGSKSLNGPSADRVMEVMNGITDASSSAIAADMCNQISTSQGGGLALLHMGDSAINYDLENHQKDDNNSDQQNDQKDDNRANGLSAEGFTKVLEMKIDVEACIQVLPSHGCQKTSQWIDDSLNNSGQANDKREDKSVDSPSAANVIEAREVKSDSTTDIKVEICTQTLPIEEHACNLKKSSFEIAANCFSEKSVSQLSCEPFGAVDDRSSKRLDVPDLYGKDGIGDTNSSSTSDCTRQTNSVVKDDIKFDRVLKTKCPGIGSPSSQKSSQTGKSKRKTQTKRSESKCRNTVKVAYPRGSIELTFKVARRNRSCFSKPARSSIWGLLGNITQYFDQNNELGVNQIQNQRSLKVRGSKGKGKQKKNQAGRNSRGSRGNCNTSTTHVRLKVKVGKELGQSSPNINISDVINTSVLANAIDGNHRTSSWGTTSELPKLPTAIEYKLENEGIGRQLQCFKENMEKTHSDASILDVHLENKEQECTVILEKPAGDAADDSCGIPSQIVVETLTGTTENRYIDPGTSPDSEVINLNPDAQVGAGHVGDLHEAVLISSIDFTAPRDVTRSKRVKKKDKLSCGGNCILEDRLPSPVSMNKTKLSKKCRCRQKTGGGLYSSETLTSSTTTNALSISSSDKELSAEPLSVLRGTAIGVSREDSKAGSGKEATTCFSQDVGPRLSESNNSMNLLSSAKVKGHKLPKSSKSGGKSKGRSKVSDSAKSRGQNSCRRRENQRELVTKGEVKEKGVSDQVVCKMESHSEKGNNIIEDFGNTNTGDNVASFDVSNLDMVPGVVDQNSPLHKAWVSCDDCHKWRRIPPTLADSIGITNCKWTCKDNEDKAFADCTIAQEMTNAEINAELEISDDACEEDAPDSRLNYMKLECRPSKVNQTSEFTQILTNQFLHRSPKTQTIDEIMVCHCKPALNGRLGCRDECLNRMLNIECVQGTCPCGDLCSNQQFQKKQYAKLEWFRCGKKGYGLQVLENVSKGHFLIEYVGEVLDMHSYQARQKEYASMGHKHFYFMTLNGNEVIDACDKGNLGRFINHSCDPNCRTEKWVVNGEICIGLFALRSIKKGEELTFDYNYVRVFGAAAKKCFCGSPQCRGYIGGDLLNTEVIVQCDSDEEYPEPVMLLEDDETGDSLANATSRTSSVFDAEMPAQSMLEDKKKMNESVTAVGLFEITSEIEDSMNRTSSAVSQVRSSVEVEDSTGKLTSSVQPVAEDVTSKPVSTVQQEISMEEATVNKALCATQRLETSNPTVTLGKSLPDGLDANRKSNADTVDDKRVSSKLRPLMKTSRSSNSSKKRIVISKALKTNKPQVMINIPQVLSTKSKKIMESSANGRFEVVQEKLNELLDADGGISKRKDAPKGYLKLLLLTVASGDRSNGEAIQSNRDLSMILDALMKTKSRMVLIDIINKNGLRMLHNIMKQYRRDFKKIPILRKLLKVLEYLAVREILTLEHINGGPPCPGMESFRESMLSLTEHEDKQVHQIARSFRDRWIPRPVRKHSYMDRDNDRTEFHRNPIYNRFPAPHNPWHDQATRPPEAIDCVKQTVLGTIPGNTDVQEGCSASCIGVSPANGTKPRKRKSRWDQPAEIKPDSRSVQLMEKEKDSRLLQESESSQLRNTGEAVLDHIDSVSREDRNCHGDLQNLCRQDEAIRFNDEGLNIQEDVPPGFSFPHKPPMVLSNALSSANDMSHQNLCYSKHPLETVIGHPRERFTSRLPVSYGIPLSIVQQFGTPQAENVESWVIAPGMPFHPFPPLPPYSRKDPAPPCAVNPMTTHQPAAEGQQESHGCSSFYSDGSVPSTTGSNQQDVEIPDANNQHTHKRMRDSSYEMGRRYFKQQKWNLGPPWLRKRNGWGFMGNSSKGGTCNIGIGSVENDLKNSYCPEDDVSCRVEKGGNNFYQHPQHQNQH